MKNLHTRLESPLLLTNGTWMHRLRMAFALGVLFALAILVSGCSNTDLDSGAPPVITVDVRSEETYVVGEDIIQIYVTATHVAGGPVRLSMVDKPERAQFQAFQNSAAFTWDPIASDVTGDTPRRLVFVATSSNGKTAERVVHVHLRAGNGQPRFLNSASEMYDPASSVPLTIEVRVRDDDSRYVQLDMPAHLAPEGATFEQTGDLTGLFLWNPSLEQRTKRVHTVTFIANDEDNLPVEHRVTILMKQKDTGGDIGEFHDRCEAEEVILHTPPPAQRTHKSHIIDARLNPGNTRYSSLVLYWTLDDPMNGSDAYFHSVDMYREGDFYRGLIPNQLLAPGESKTVFYNICAFDENAPSGDDTAIVCAPSSIAYSVNLYSPDEPDCLDDATRQDTPATAAPILDTAWEFWRACKDREDYHAITVQGGQEAEVFVVYSKGSALELNLMDDAQRAVPLTASSCTGYSHALLSVPEGQPARRYVLRVLGDDVAYQVTAFTEESTEPGQCIDEHLEPNDTFTDATPLQMSHTKISAEICAPDDIDIYAIDLFAGDQVVFDLAFEHARGDLDLTLFLPSQSSENIGESVGAAQSWSTDDDESIFFTTPETGTHYLLVDTGTTGNTYTLETMSTCVDSDAYAGNDNRGQAALLTLDEHTDLKLCPEQDDWFRRQGFAGTLLLGELFVHAGGVPADVTLEAYDDQGTRIAQSTPGNGRLDIEYAPTQSGPVFFKVRASKRLIYTFTLVQIDL